MVKYSAGVILYFAIFSFVYLLITPPFEGPDENLHVSYINYISQYGKLPNQYEDLKSKRYTSQGHQNPLYYIIVGSLVYFLDNNKRVELNHPGQLNQNWSGSENQEEYNRNFFVSDNDKFIFYLLRFLSVIFSIINLFYITKILMLFTNDKLIIFFSLSFIATISQLQFISSMINNDSLANMLSTAAIYYIFRMIINNHYRDYIYSGIFSGIGFLAKKTLFFLFPCLLITLVFIYFSSGKKPVKNIILSLSIYLIISSPLLLRNYILYGDLFGTQMEIATMPQFVFQKSLISYYFINPFSIELFKSFFGIFGWMKINLPGYTYVYYLLVTGLCFAGYIMALRRNRNINFILSFIFILTCLTGIIYFNLTFTQYQGRYLFPVISLIAVFYGMGLSGLMQNKKYMKVTAGIILLLNFIINIMSVYIVKAHYS